MCMCAYSSGKSYSMGTKWQTVVCKMHMASKKSLNLTCKAPSELILITKLPDKTNLDNIATTRSRF